MLDKFAQELKEARENKELSLQQLANKTRIDLKFLESMEKGDFGFLPEIYVKAFIKDCAKVLDLDENLLIKKFEAAKQGKEIDEKSDSKEDLNKTQKVDKTPEQISPKISNEQVAYNDYAKNETQSSPGKANQQKTIIGIVIGVIAIVAIIYFAFFNSSQDIIVSEKPYDQVMHDNQKRFQEEKPEETAPPVVNSAVGDSLSLLLEASDTSWVKIMLDNSKVDEFILFPNSKKEIKAGYNYTMILGNSGAMSFKLNNKDLAFSGKHKQVEYVKIDSTGLQLLKEPPSFK